MNIKTHFRRFEFKYIMPRATADKIIPALLEHMKWDSYAQSLPSKAYSVTSYYLDNSNYSCYYDKIAGLDSRSKYRIRSYQRQPEDDQAVFMEIKRKQGNIIIKDRARLAWGLAKDLIIHNILKPALAALPEAEQATIKEFYWSKAYNCLTPTVMVTYDRKPLFSKYDDRFRVTFDYNITAQRLNHQFLPVGRLHPVLTDAVVLELKYNNVLPYWFYEIIQGHSLIMQPYSKYCSSLDKINPFLIK